MNDQIIEIDEHGKVHHPTNCDCGLPGCPKPSSVRGATAEITDTQKKLDKAVAALKWSFECPPKKKLEWVEKNHPAERPIIKALRDGYLPTHKGASAYRGAVLWTNNAHARAALTEIREGERDDGLSNN